MPGSSTAVQCHVCNRSISRKADLPRHMKIHELNEAHYHRCPHEGCNYMTRQRSNLKTHMNRHSGERPHKCPSCDYACADPAALTRHREDIHDYIPRKNSRRKQPDNKREARRRRRVAPYPSSSSGSSASQSPVTPDPELDLSMLLFLDDADDTVKNTFAAFDTDLIPTLPAVNGAQANPGPETSLFTSGSATALDVPMDGNYQVLPGVGGIEATKLSPGDFSGWERFFGGLYSEAALAFTPTALPVPLVSHPVANAPLPTFTPFSLPVAHHAVSTSTSFDIPSAQFDDTRLVPSIPIAPLPSSFGISSSQFDGANFSSYETQYELPFGVESAHAGYALYNQMTEAFNHAEFSQTRVFDASDMGVPQVKETSYSSLAGWNDLSHQGFYN